MAEKFSPKPENYLLSTTMNLRVVQGVVSTVS